MAGPFTHPHNGYREKDDGICDLNPKQWVPSCRESDGGWVTYGVEDHLFGDAESAGVRTITPSPARLVLFEHPEAYMPTGNDDVPP